MKILQIIGTLNRGGAETLLVNIQKNISKEYKMDFLVFEDKKYELTDEVKKNGGNIIFILPPNKQGMFGFINNLRKICKENKYDVVHAHTLFNCGFCVFASYLAGVKIRISHGHSTKYLDKKINITKKIYYFISKLLINLFSTTCIACSKEAGNLLFYKNKKIVILKNGIDINKFLYSEKNDVEIRKKYNIEKDALIIGNVGRLVYIKNQMFLLKVFKMVKKEVPNSYLFLIGDGIMKKDIIEEINKLELTNSVILAGNVDDVEKYYSSFNVFAFPSLFEGLPLTLLEAQCNGVPIIASEKISKECNVSNKINFLPIDNLDSCEIWYKEIIKERNYGRYDAIKEIEDSGYSIKSTVEQIERIYNEKI